MHEVLQKSAKKNLTEGIDCHLIFQHQKKYKSSVGSNRTGKIIYFNVHCFNKYTYVKNLEWALKRGLCCVVYNAECPMKGQS